MTIAKKCTWAYNINLENYNLIKENQFRAILIGGKYVISKKSFDEWLDGEIIRSGKGQTQGEQKPEENRNDKTDRRNSP